MIWNTHEIAGIIVLLSATGMASIALPMQIRENYRKKKVGLHWLLVLLATITYTGRAIFALTGINGVIWYIFIPDMIGSVASFIIIYQMIRYRHHSG